MPCRYRMVGYIGRGIQQHRLPILFSIVIYLRPDAGRTIRGILSPRAARLPQVVVQYKVIRLIEIDGQRILDAGQCLRACCRLRR